MVSRRWHSIRHDGKSYNGTELRSAPPPLACGGLVAMAGAVLVSAGDVRGLVGHQPVDV